MNEHVELEEIIVTAQKVAKSLQDVPISMAAISGETIADAGINNMQALSSRVPGLQIGAGPINDNIYIRGIGSGINASFEQSVGMYIDGIYMGRSHQYRTPFMDVERVEVLRGPQGVLFGKNTVAGVVNITTASPQPGDDTYGEVSAAYEPEADTQVYSAMFNTSLSDTLAARVALKYRETDGWVDNKLLGETEPQSDESSVRVSLTWAPDDDFRATLKLSQADVTKVGNPIVFPHYAPVSDNPAELGAVSALAPALFAVLQSTHPEMLEIAGKDFSGYKDSGSVLNKPGMDLETKGVALNAEWLFDGYTLTSVTGYSGYEFARGLDGDFGPLDFIPTGGNEEFDQISQEIRLTSNTEGPIEWVAGAYVERQNRNSDGSVVINSSFGEPETLNAIIGHTSLFRALTGGIYDVDAIVRHGSSEDETQSASIFAQATWSISDTLRATVGLRYAEERKEVDKQLWFSDSNLGLEPGDADPENYAFQPFLDAMWGGFGTQRHDLRGFSRKTDNLTPALNIEWDVAEDAMLYFSYSEGYKSGGFNGAASVGVVDTDGDGIGETPLDDFEYEDEEVKTFEIGGKFVLANRSMRLNWALFHTKYTNLQVTSYSGTNFTVGNAAATTIEGFEADWEWAASENLRLAANIAYLDYAYDNFKTAACSAQKQLQLVLADPSAEAGACTTDLSGETGVFAPEWSAGISADYSRSLNDIMELKLGADANFKDEYYADDDLNEKGLQEATWKFNLRAGITSVDEKWEVMLYGNNVTDEQTLTHVQDATLLPGAYIGYADEGRVWGLRGTYRF
jgi:outer membrane receptor protein involved in Fe transport|nr:TonB-dependent receptor [Pseudomaricurvus alkylphenolicus]